MALTDPSFKSLYNCLRLSTGPQWRQLTLRCIAVCYYVLYSATHKGPYTVGRSSATKKALLYIPNFSDSSLFRLAKRGFPFVGFRWHTFVCSQVRRHLLRSLSVPPSECIDSASTGRISMKFDTGDFY